MASREEADTWYSSRPATLRPLVTFRREDYELESKLLCSEDIQKADDCLELAQKKGASTAQAYRACNTPLAAAWHCKTKIVCPVEIKAFMHGCLTKRASAHSDRVCQHALSSLKTCATAMNIPEWWMTPSVLPKDRAQFDDLSIKHFSAQGSLPSS